MKIKPDRTKCNQDIRDHRSFPNVVPLFQNVSRHARDIVETKLVLHLLLEGRGQPAIESLENVQQKSDHMHT
jgi:hypothetical protein